MLNPTQKSRPGKLLPFKRFNRPAHEFGARWVDKNDNQVGVTEGATMCWAPRQPHRWHASNGQYEVVWPCRECGGCLQFYRRRHAERLHARYKDDPRRFSLVKFKVPTERQLSFVRMARRLKDASVEPPFFRYGPDWAGLLTTTPAVLREALTARGVEVRTIPVTKQKYRSAWDFVTSGMLISRVQYGENVKRLYGRGLPAADTQHWENIKLVDYEPYHRHLSARAWTSDGRRLLPPRVLDAGKIDRPLIRAITEWARTPEDIESSRSFMVRLMSRVEAQKAPKWIPKSEEECAHLRETYRRVAELSSRESLDADPNSESTPPLVRGGLHKISPVENERPPPEPVDGPWVPGPNGLPIHWMERERLDREKWKASRARSDEILSRRRK